MQLKNLTQCDFKITHTIDINNYFILNKFASECKFDCLDVEKTDLVDFASFNCCFTSAALALRASLTALSSSDTIGISRAVLSHIAISLFISGKH